MTIEDADDLFLIRSDPETVRYTPIEPDETVEQTREWLRKILATSNTLFFCIEIHRRIITILCDHSQNPIPKGIGFFSAIKVPEIGYGINRDFWSRGYMTEALEGFITTYWDLFPEGYPGLIGDEKNTLTAQSFQENGPSQAVLKKCGFQWWKEEEEMIKGQKVTVVWYRLWRPEKGKAMREPGYWSWDIGATRHQKTASIGSEQKYENYGDVETFEKKDVSEMIVGEDSLWTKVRKGLYRCIMCMY